MPIVDNEMRYSLISGMPISASLEPYLDVVVDDFVKSPNAVGMNRRAYAGGYLPPLWAVTEYIENNSLSEDKLELLYASELYKIIVNNSHTSDELCCSEAMLNTAHEIWYSAEDIIDITTLPLAFKMEHNMQKLQIGCRLHDPRNKKIGVIVSGREYDQKTPLKLNDILRFGNAGLFATESTVIEVINAVGISTRSSLLDDNWDSHFQSRTDNYLEAKEAITALSPYGERLAWFVLCTHGSISYRVFTSRMAYVKELVAGIGLYNTVQYIKAGVPNIKEVAYLAKRNIPVDVAARAYSVGVVKSADIVKFHKHDIDVSIISALSGN